MLDAELLKVAGLFSCLSFLMCFIIRKLPIYCQTSWSLISVWGIACVGAAEAWLRWNQPMLAQWVIVDLCVIFLAAFPGQLMLNTLQKREWLEYWRMAGVPVYRVIERIWTRKKVLLSEAGFINK